MLGEIQFHAERSGQLIRILDLTRICKDEIDPLLATGDFPNGARPLQGQTATVGAIREDQHCIDVENVVG